MRRAHLTTRRIAFAFAPLIVAGLTLGAAPPPAAPDYSKVEIKTTDLGNKTYMLEGQGGNITVAVGDDGVIMVDTEFAPLHDKIKAAVAKVSPQPIKYIVNTHYHGDHTGGGVGRCPAEAALYGGDHDGHGQGPCGPGDA